MIVTPSVSISGGRERVMSNFALNLAAEIDMLFVVMDNILEPFYALPPNVQVIGVDSYFMKDKSVHRNKLGYVADVLKLRKILKAYPEYKMVIGTDGYINIFLALASSRMRRYLIAFEHLPFTMEDRRSFWTRLRNRTYRSSINLVVTLTERDKASFQQLVKKVVTIPNALTFSSPGKAALRNKIMLAVGRLSMQKGFDMLIKAMPPVFKQHPDWKLVIIGHGEMEHELKELIAGRDLQNHIAIEPPTTQIREEYLRAAMYILSSRLEAFPMVLIEAMSHGLPCVCFDCVTGPREIVRDGEDGILVAPGDMDGLAEAVLKLINNPSLRQGMGDSAYRNIQRYAPEKIYGMWVNLFNEIA